MRILFITQFCEPEPVIRVFPLARELTALGHEVEILTGFPNYPGGRIFPGYRTRRVQRETLEGIPVVRVPIYPYHGHGPLKRIWNSLSIALSALLWGLGQMQRPDVAFVYGHPTIVLPAMWLRWRKGVPWVYDVQDLWPDTVSASGIPLPPILAALLRRFIKFVYGRAPRLTVISPGFRAALAARGIPAERLTVIYNWCDESKLCVPPRDDALAEEMGLAGRFVVMYAGNLGAAQGLEAIVEAAARLAPELPDVQVVFVGGGVSSERLAALVQERGLTNVSFVPPVPMAEVGRVLSVADVLVVHLTPHPLFSITVPSKTQAYLYAGKPILIAAQGDAADLVLRAGAGLRCEPGDAASIAAGIRELHALGPERLAEMGRRGREFYDAELSVALGARRFEALLTSCLTPQPQAKAALSDEPH